MTPEFALSPLRRRKVAVPVSLALLILIVYAQLYLVGMVLYLEQARSHSAGIFFSALGLATLAVLVPAAILLYLDRRERESIWLCAIAFLWGGLVATGLSAPFNSAFLHTLEAWVVNHPALLDLLGPDAALMIGAPIAGPLVEETIKGLGLVLIFLLLHDEFDGVRDGLVLGGIIGVGFTWMETSMYIAQGYTEYGVAAFGFQLGSRFALFGLSGHVLYTALFGAFLGWSAQTAKNWWRWLAPPLGLLLAILAHAVHNSLGLVLTILGSAAGEPPPTGNVAPPLMPIWQSWLIKSAIDLVIFLPFVILLLVLLRQSGKWEREIIRSELRDETEPVITPAEYEQILHDRGLRTRRIRGPDRRRLGALVNAQNELAFRKRRLRLQGTGEAGDAIEALWRGRIVRLREKLTDDG